MLAKCFEKISPKVKPLDSIAVEIKLLIRYTTIYRPTWFLLFGILPEIDQEWLGPNENLFGSLA